MYSIRNYWTTVLAFLVIGGLGAASSSLCAQEEEDENVFELSPFEVEEAEGVGYLATTTLAGTRLRSNLSDLGSSVSVLTQEFLDDIGGTDSQSVLAYAPNIEVGGPVGNYQGATASDSFANPNETEQFFRPGNNTRVRGLVNADNTQNYFRTSVDWDGYNVDRVDILRGPNSILFGLGSPGGVVNASTISANLYEDSGEIDTAFDQFGTYRLSGRYNKVLIEDQLAVRVAFLSDNQEFRQEFAFDDEERFFIAAKFRPEALNQNGNTFEITLDFEDGNGTSNRPRTSPPIDHITPWFRPVTIGDIKLPEGTNFNGFTNGIVPGVEVFADKLAKDFLDGVGRNQTDATRNWFSAHGSRLEVDEAGNQNWRVGRVFSHGALQPNGNVYTGNPNAARRLFGAGYLHQVVANVNQAVAATGHPFGAAFVPNSITDPSVFDFYNTLIDGPNKKEWNDFNQFRAVLSNTFFNQKMGYELSYFKENSERGQTTFLSGNNRIFVDIFTEDIQGNPNPHFGKAYIQENTFEGNRTLDSDLEGYRVSAYFEHDFEDNVSGGWLNKVLGRHIFNGAISSDETLTDQRVFARHIAGDALVEKMGWGLNRRFNNNTFISLRKYLSGDLSQRSDISGANIPGIQDFIIPPGGTIPLTFFDTTWNAPDSVDPGTPWVNPLGQNWEEAANPANYVGWTTGNFEIIDALSGNPADKDLATRRAILQENVVDSKILTWQGFLFNGILVGTYGWREDESDSVRLDAPQRSFDNGADVSPETYNLRNGDAFDLKTRSTNYSVVAHLNKIAGLDRLPLNVSLSYNEGENFNPTAGRRDILGGILPPPQGSTEEYGIVLSTKDNRYTLRVVEYKTAVLNATSEAVPDAFRLNQFFANNGAAWKVADGVLRDQYETAAETPEWSIDDQEQIHLPAYRAFEAEFEQRFPTFVSSWLTAGTWNPSTEETLFTINGLNVEDNVSKGYEFEFTANPTDQLRLTINASKTKALRDNVPGEAASSVYEFIQDAMFDGTTPSTAGAIRSGFNIDETMADFWLRDNWANFSVVQQLNGQLAPELVEWRINGLANYTFREGLLNGFGVGGAYRYESGSSIGFPRHFDEFGFVTADINNPFERGSSDRVDLWVSYRRPLMNNKIHWKIQLNLFNAFGENKLIPTIANPDGAFAQFRIQQGTSWRIANTFEF